MQIDTTTPMDVSFDIGPKPATAPKFCGFSCCLPQGQRNKNLPDTTRTAPTTPSDEDDEIPQFFIDADGIQQQDVTENDFWKKFMSILWMLFAAKYWTGQRQEEDGEKSLPPELNFDDEEVGEQMD